MRIRRSIAIAAVSVGASVLAAGSALAAPERFVQFRTPSTARIGCGYDSSQGGYLRCEIGTGLRPHPRRPKGCMLDWGSSFFVDRTGRAKVTCAGDTVYDPRARVLRYGKTWRGGGFTCRSQRAGLRCTNVSRHGFYLSRRHSYRF